MKWLLALALLAGAPALLQAQGQPANPGAVAKASAFELEIAAPDEIRTLLEHQLELLRYRELTDLSDPELARLLTTARQNTRDLLATLGYFSPDINIEQRTTDGATVARWVKLSVTPGPPRFHPLWMLRANSSFTLAASRRACR